MDRNPQKIRHSKTVPIRHRTGEGSVSTGSTSSDVEGTFIPLPSTDPKWHNVDFINPKFEDNDGDEGEEVVEIVDLQSDRKPPLIQLFPEDDNLAATASTSHALTGKQADFTLLKPSKKLNPNQSKLASVSEVVDDK